MNFESIVKKILKLFEKDFRVKVLDILKDKNKLMRLNQVFGTKYGTLTICIAASLIVLALVNFIANGLGYLLNFEFYKVIRLRNFFLINFKLFGESSSVRFFFFAGIFIIVLVNLRLIYLINISLADKNVGQKGTARWTTKEEIREQFKAIPDRNEQYPGDGGLPVYREGQTLYIDDSNTNNLIIGITRSGKGEMLVIPGIDIYSRAEAQPSLVILNMKAELYAITKDPLEQRGYDIYHFTLQEAGETIQFNPLYYIIKEFKEGNTAEASMLCEAFAHSIYAAADSGNNDENSAFFLNNATAAVTALILAHIEDALDEDNRLNAKVQLQWYQLQQTFLVLSEEAQAREREEYRKLIMSHAPLEDILEMTALPEEADITPYLSHENEDKISMYSILHTFQSLARQRIDEFKTMLEVYFEQRPSHNRAKAAYTAIEVSGDKTKGSIFSQALSKLTMYDSEYIASLTSTSSLDVEKLGFGEKPIAVFLSLPLDDRSKDSIAMSFISQIYDRNLKRALKTSDQKCKRKIIYHLDEVGNGPIIESLDVKLSTCLGLNMMFNLFLQNYEQLEKYGKAADTIRANCANTFYIQTSSEKTAEEFSKNLGNKTITNITRSGQQMQLGKTITELYEERPLLYSHELRSLMPEEMVIYRVMKRTDLQNNPVKPTPIFCNIEEGSNMTYRYKYLGDTFKHIVLPENKGIFEDEELEDMTFDYEIPLHYFNYKDLSEKQKNGEEIEEDEIYLFEEYQEMFQYDITLDELPNYSKLREFLKERQLPFKKKVKLSWLLMAMERTTLSLEDKLTIYQLLNIKVNTFVTLKKEQEHSYDDDKEEEIYLHEGKSMSELVAQLNLYEQTIKGEEESE